MASTPHIVGLTNRGIFLLEAKDPYTEKIFRDESTQNIRSVIFSPKGTYFAYRTDKKVEVINCADWSVVTSLEGNFKDMLFSPLDNYFMVWELFLINKENPTGKPNLHVYKSATGELLTSFTQKNQSGWEPQWSSDEQWCAVQAAGRVQLFAGGALARWQLQLQAERLHSFSLAPAAAPYHLAVFTLGKAGQPAAWRVQRLPELDAPRAVVTRSSFHCDKAAFHWNRKGTHLLVMTQSDVDKTGGSYYGKQSLSFGDVKGNSANMAFSKEGPIHAVAWSPGNANEWAAVYGHAPAKATLFNAKCEPLFEFGTGAWNAIYYSPDGSYILLGGFGNIATGHITVWDARGRRLGACAAPDTTRLQWGPRSECFLTATTYPRLTVGNGYKVWHYSGALLHRRACGEREQLLGLAWQSGAFPPSDLAKTAPKGISDGAPKAAGAYRPPGARDRPSTFTFHEHEAPHRPGEAPNAAPSKAAIKQKEKREARKAKKAAERDAGGEGRDEGGEGPSPPPAAPRPAFVSTGDPDKDKKIKNLNKKLSDIEKLKQQKAAGKPLEVNQLAKITSEPALLKELQALRL